MTENIRVVDRAVLILQILAEEGKSLGVTEIARRVRPNVYYFYEVYDDQAALEKHRTTPHYAVWSAATDTLDGPAEVTRCRTVFPGARAYWTGR